MAIKVLELFGIMIIEDIAGADRTRGFAHGADDPFSNDSPYTPAVPVLLKSLAYYESKQFLNPLEFAEYQLLRFGGVAAIYLSEVIAASGSTTQPTTQP